MKSKILAYILIIGSVIGAVYIYRDPLGKAKDYYTGKLFPCSQPITYSIGNIDPKFGLTKDQVIADLQTSSQLWNESQHKTLFVYEPNSGTVKINFVYDARQESTQQLKNLGLVINDDESTYNSLKAKYDSLQATYNQQKDALDATITAYKQEKAAYDEQVAYWSSRGGAPKQEYNQLQQERQKLTAEAAAIQQQQNDFNNLVDTINALANVLNKLIAELNLKVSNYNNVGSQQGTEFEEGVYKSSVSSQEIDIYQFDNQTKLLRVLAHELGHAIGLDHVGDPEAIMYRLNQGKKAVLTQADKDALKNVCSSKFNFGNFGSVIP